MRIRRVPLCHLIIRTNPPEPPTGSQRKTKPATPCANPLPKSRKPHPRSAATHPQQQPPNHFKTPPQPPPRAPASNKIPAIDRPLRGKTRVPRNPPRSPLPKRRNRRFRQTRLLPRQSRHRTQQLMLRNRSHQVPLTQHRQRIQSRRTTQKLPSVLDRLFVIQRRRAQLHQPQHPAVRKATIALPPCHINVPTLNHSQVTPPMIHHRQMSHAVPRH